MKVSLIAPPRGQTEFGTHFKNIYKEIEKLGYTHVTDIAIAPTEKFYEEMNKGEEAHKEFYNTMTKAVQQADICVFETSSPSLGTGSLIDKALSFSKPTVVLYHEGQTPFFLSGSEEDKLIKRSYNEKNLKKILKECIDLARERRDKRFNFFISPKLLEYLETASNTEGITKSKFIRNLIVGDMRKKGTKEEEAA